MASGSLWRDPDFLKLWAGQTISEIGSRITREGIPLTAVLLLHAQPLEMGFLSSLAGLAALVFGPLAGLVADRNKLRPILVWTDLGRAVVLCAVPLAAAQGWLSMPLLCAVAVSAGVLTVFFDVTYQSMLPRLVSGPQLLEGNSKLSLSFSTAEAIGPGLAGFLIQTLTAPRAILLDGLSYLVSAASVLWIRRPEQRPAPETHEPFWSGLRAGFAFVWRNRILRAVACRAGTTSFFWGFFSALYTLWAIQHLGFTPLVFGFVITLGGVGSMVGSALAPRLIRWVPLGTLLIGATLGAGLLTLLISAPSGPGWFGVLCLSAAQLFGDVMFPIYGIHEMTLRQSLAPPERLGRVNAVMNLLYRGFIPLGSVVGGALATVISLRTTFFLCGLGILSASLWLVFSPVRKLRAASTSGLAE
jgi:predicted MFS family arabinose efflux permease